jgi:hypothetical protein
MSMKSCPNCSRENDDDAAQCAGCGMKFEIEQSSPKFSDPMPRAHKWQLWLGAWGLVAIATLVIHPAYLLAVPFFPVGLLDWLPHGEEKAIEGWMIGAWVIGWMLYVFLSAAMFASKRMGIFFIIYVIFCVLLALNVVGCQRVMQAASGIH